MEIKNERIELYYRDVLISYGKLLRRLMLDTFENDFERYWGELYKKACIDADNKTTSFFFENLRKHYEPVQKVKDNDRIYDISKGWTFEERMGIFDPAEILKQLQFNKYVKEKFERKYHLSQNSVGGIAKKCRETRNGTDHFDSSDPKGFISKKGLSNFVDDCNKLVSFCKHENLISQTAKLLYDEYIRISVDLCEKAGYPPINLIKFSKEVGYDKDYIIAICNKGNISYSVFENGETYILSVPKKKIIDIINETEAEDKINKISAIINGNGTAGSNVEAVAQVSAFASSENNVAQVNEIKTSKPLKVVALSPLTYLAGYERGFLAPNQFDELCSTHNFFADESALLNSGVRKFLTSVLIRRKTELVKKACPLYVHRAARNEIYDLATMEIDETDGDPEKINEQIEQRKNAKAALDMIVELRHRGLLNIVGKPAYDESSSDMLLDFLADFKEKRFCIVTQEGVFAELLAETGTKTLCAIKIAGGNPLVWSAVAKNLKADQNTYVLSIKGNQPVAEEKAESKKQKEPAEAEQQADDEQKPAQNNPQAKNDSASESSNDSASENRNESVSKSNTDSTSNSDFYVKNTKNFSAEIKIKQFGDKVFDESGKEYILGKVLGSGGEGSVYEIADTNLVAKIYHKNKRNVTLYKKLKLMLDVPFSTENIVWPVSILFDEEKNYVGFLMKKIPPYCKQIGESVLMINNDDVRKKYIPTWTRKDLVKLCISTVNIFKLLHDKNVLMGDINPANILVNPNDSSEVYFVDCDSYQISDDYLCTVGTPIFTSPDYYKRCNRNPQYSKEKRTLNDERYAIATLLFEILMNGQAPFASKSTGKADIIDDICNHRFSFKTKESTGEDVPDGPYKMIWNNIHYKCKSMFINTFEKNTVYNEKGWIAALNQYYKALQSGEYTDMLFPKKYLDTKGDFIDFRCSCCGQEANMYKEQYNKILTRANEINVEPIYLCNDCKANMNVPYDIPTVCEYCGRSFIPTIGQLWRNDVYGYKIKCDKCKNRR